MTSNLGSYSFEQLEARLLSMLDDLAYRVDNEGKPKNPVHAAVNCTLSIAELSEKIKETAKAYRGRIVMNRFRLAPYDAAEPLMIDDDKPNQARRDFVRQISALAKQGKVLRRTEWLKYKSVFDSHPKWLGAKFYPTPDEIAKLVVADDASINDGRRPNGYPSAEDEQFLLDTQKRLVERGYVLAADADRYEEIMKAHPEYAKGKLRRVRGSEARRFLELRNGTALKNALGRKLK